MIISKFKSNYFMIIVFVVFFTILFSSVSFADSLDTSDDGGGEGQIEDLPYSVLSPLEADDNIISFDNMLREQSVLLAASSTYDANDIYNLLASVLYTANGTTYDIRVYDPSLVLQFNLLLSKIGSGSSANNTVISLLEGIYDSIGASGGSPSTILTGLNNIISSIVSSHNDINYQNPNDGVVITLGYMVNTIVDYLSNLSFYANTINNTSGSSANYLGAINSFLNQFDYTWTENNVTTHYLRSYDQWTFNKLIDIHNSLLAFLGDFDNRLDSVNNSIISGFNQNHNDLTDFYNLIYDIFYDNELIEINYYYDDFFNTVPGSNQYIYSYSLDYNSLSRPSNYINRSILTSFIFENDGSSFYEFYILGNNCTVYPFYDSNYGAPYVSNFYNRTGCNLLCFNDISSLNSSYSYYVDFPVVSVSSFQGYYPNISFTQINDNLLKISLDLSFLNDTALSYKYFSIFTGTSGNNRSAFLANNSTNNNNWSISIYQSKSSEVKYNHIDNIDNNLSHIDSDLHYQNDQIDKLVEMYASEDELEAKRNQLEYESSVLESFTGSGSAAASLDDVSSVSEVSSTVSSGLSSGGSISNALGVFNPISNFWGWFSQENYNLINGIPVRVRSNDGFIDFYSDNQLQLQSILGGD